MYKPGDKDYNKYWDGLPTFRTNIKTLINKLEELRQKYGDNVVVCMQYDGGGGFDDIMSVYATEFHDNLVVSLCCLENEEAEEYGYPLKE